MNPTDLDMQDAEQAAQQQADIDAMQKAAKDAILAARHRPITDEEAMAIAYSAGIPNEVYKEIRS